MKLTDVVYVAAKLATIEREKILKVVKSLGYLRYSRVICDHITIAYDSAVTHKTLQILGEYYPVTITGFIWNHHAICAWIPENKDHITIATDNITKPVYSNELVKEYLEGKSGVYFTSCDPIKINPYIMAFCKDGQWKDH